MKFYGIDMVSEFKPSTSEYFEIFERNMMNATLKSLYDNPTGDMMFAQETDNGLIIRFLAETYLTPKGKYNLIDYSASSAIYNDIYKERLYEVGNIIQTANLYNNPNPIERILATEICSSNLPATTFYISFDDGATWTAGNTLGWTVTDFTGTSNGGGNYRLKLKFLHGSTLYYWSYVKSMNIARGDCAGSGTYTNMLSFGGYDVAGVATGATEMWDGVNWSTKSAFSTARATLAGCGTTTDTLAFGGETDTQEYVANTDKWNGTAWATTTALVVGRYRLGGAGTTAAAISFGGGTTGGSFILNTVEKWNGSVWATTSGTFTEVKYTVAGCGTATDALCVGGYSGSSVTTTEIWDGSSWATTGALSSAKSSLAAVGTTASALAYAGSYVTEKWNGTSWSTSVMPSLTINRYGIAGAGSTSGAIAAGGGGGGGYMSVTERYSVASQLGFAVKIN
jgi:hypothetical protein